MADEATREEHITAVFATMVMQLTNMAAMFMGKIPNPETKQPTVDLDAAQMFIDQLEMLEIKTRGNLSQEEQVVLKQGLTMVRMAFVEAVEAADKKAPAPEKAPPAATTEEGSEAEARKKFTKKY
jgi:hypothetical protein